MTRHFNGFFSAEKLDKGGHPPHGGGFKYYWEHDSRCSIMKLKQSSLFIVCITLLALGLSGCARKSGDDLYARNNQDVNVLGIVNYAPNSYRDVRPTSINVRTSELVSRKNISGNNVSLLWGALVFSDY